MILTDLWDFKSGPLAIEDYYMFAYMVNKPYAKLYCCAMGILLGYNYIEILKYRKLETEEEKKEKYPKLHAIIKRPWIGWISIILGAALIITSLTCAY